MEEIEVSGEEEHTESEPNEINNNKPKRVPTSEMVDSAIRTLDERSGSSLKAINKYLAANYLVDVKKSSPYIKKYIKKSLETGHFVQPKGKDKTGSIKLTGTFKLSAAANKPKKPIKVIKLKVKKADKNAEIVDEKEKKAVSNEKGKKTTSVSNEKGKKTIAALTKKLADKRKSRKSSIIIAGPIVKKSKKIIKNPTVVGLTDATKVEVDSTMVVAVASTSKEPKTKKRTVSKKDIIPKEVASELKKKKKKQ